MLSSAHFVMKCVLKWLFAFGTVYVAPLKTVQKNVLLYFKMAIFSSKAYKLHSARKLHSSSSKNLPLSMYTVHCSTVYQVNDVTVLLTYGELSMSRFSSLIFFHDSNPSEPLILPRYSITKFEKFDSAVCMPLWSQNFS